MQKIPLDRCGAANSNLPSIMSKNKSLVEEISLHNLLSNAVVIFDEIIFMKKRGVKLKQILKVYIEAKVIMKWSNTCYTDSSSLR